MRKTKVRNRILLMTLLGAAFLTACAAGGAEDGAGSAGTGDATDTSAGPAVHASSAVDFDHDLDDYVPAKDHYNFYFTYKIVHPWWDAVALGMEDAQRQFLDRGVTITYEYMAPEAASAEDQIRRLEDARERDFDVIGVDVADAEIISPMGRSTGSAGMSS